jgi:ABC-type multidrug transport system permease subunit
MPTWTLAKKDLRLLLRDPRALVILLAMPFIFILVLGVSLGEGFGQKPDDRLRVSVVDEDAGPPRNLDAATRAVWFPYGRWADVVKRDLAETGGIRLEIIPTRQEAEELVRRGERPAVLILGPRFSKRLSRSSFLAEDLRLTLLQTCCGPCPGLPVNLALTGLSEEGQELFPLYLLDGINPFHRDGVMLDKLDVTVLRDPTQPTTSAIIDQVAQGTMLRVVLPWMIGRAFEKLGEETFIDRLSSRMKVPIPGGGSILLSKVLTTSEQKLAVGKGVQEAIRAQFSRYDLTAKTWAALTKSLEEQRGGAGTITYQPEGSGLLKQGAIRYQVLVPSYTVMFAFFLVLTVGWLFVAERRQGTMKRLVAAPIGRTQILAGKLLPCLLLSLGQGLFLLGAGKLVFGMSWGAEPLWLLPVVVATSLAAMGLALLVAAAARTETQVSIYGTLLVLVLAGLSGCLMGDRSLMPEGMQQISRFTPHAWALDAYRQLLINPEPNLQMVTQACLVLAAFGMGFVAVAWWVLKLE